MVRVKDICQGVERGKEFSKWEVLGSPFSVGKGKSWRVVVKCKCGHITTVTCCGLSNGGSRSCKTCSSMTHGYANTKLYGVWGSMKKRCDNEKYHGYADYGGRGIKVCNEWSESFESFLEWALSNGYAEGLEIDRFPNNDGNYEPTNCRWVTPSKNGQNKRNNRNVDAFGERKCVTEWLRDPRCIVKKKATLFWRLCQGWNPEIAMTSP